MSSHSDFLLIDMLIPGFENGVRLFIVQVYFYLARPWPTIVQAQNTIVVQDKSFNQYLGQ